MEMIKKVYFQRYLKAVLLFCLATLGIYCYNAYQNVNYWHQDYKYYHSQEMINDFEAYPEHYVKTYQENSNTPIYYSSVEEYRVDMLRVFSMAGPKYLETIRDTGSSSESESNLTDYEVGIPYYSNWSIGPSLAPFLFFAAGFLLFFIDHKTNFNRFLFSLPIKRQPLFKGKLLYIGCPVLLVGAIAIFLNCLIVYFGIPSPYFNATLSELLYSGFSHYIFLFFSFCLGIFFGTLLNHLVLAPLALIAGSAIVFSTIYSFVYSLNALLTYLFPDFRMNNPFAIVTFNFGKTGTLISVLVAILVFSAILLLLAAKNYQHMALENENEFVSSLALRLPTFLTLAIGGIVYFSIQTIDWYTVSGLYPAPDGYFQRMWLSLFIQTIVVIGTSFCLVYLQPIYRHWQKFRDTRTYGL